MPEDRGMKRPLAGDDAADYRPLPPRKPLFPKGKKSKAEERSGFSGRYEGTLNSQINPDFAAKKRAKLRSEKKEEDLLGSPADISVAEVQYEDDSTFEVDGIEIEPFSLKQEREEGYFDDNGNYVEYRFEQEIKDAWLDSVSVDPMFAVKIQERQIADEEYQDLSLEEIRLMKKRIANILMPGETIIQALKRLKGTSGDKRAKMSESTKLMFDQLTEDAMKLMENGEYNVYHEERDTFERETAIADDDKFDMFGDDNDDHSKDHNVKGHSDEANLSSTSAFDQANYSTTERLEASQSFVSAEAQANYSTTERLEASQSFVSAEAGTIGSDSDYVYDQSSGYYYSAALGYYYDPASKLYCCATSGIWYSFDEELGTYVEVKNDSSQET